MNAFVEHMMFRKTLAALVFSMAFLLTPRAWVDQGSVFSYHPSGSRAETIPVNLLERQDDTCLWCAPLQPVKCDDTKAPATGAPLARPPLAQPRRAPRERVRCTLRRASCPRARTLAQRIKRCLDSLSVYDPPPRSSLIILATMCYQQAPRVRCGRSSRSRSTMPTRHSPTASPPSRRPPATRSARTRLETEAPAAAASRGSARAAHHMVATVLGQDRSSERDARHDLFYDIPQRFAPRAPIASAGRHFAHTRLHTA